jgi:hypothetical protein
MVNYDGFIWLIWFYYVIMVNSNNWLNTLWFYMVNKGYIMAYGDL